MEKMTIQCEGFEAIERMTRKSGNSSAVTLPLKWLGKRVKIILLDPLDEVDEG